MSAIGVSPALRARFAELAEVWKTETCVLSSLTDIYQHWAYQAVIAIGDDAIPLLLEDIRDHWFWHGALTKITGENPAVEAAEEVVPGMLAWNADRVKTAWLEWGQRKGLIVHTE